MLVSADPTALSAHAVALGSTTPVLAAAAATVAGLRPVAEAALVGPLAAEVVELLTGWATTWTALADATEALAGQAALRAEAFRTADGAAPQGPWPPLRGVG